MRFCSQASEFTQNARLPQHTLFDMRISSQPFTQFSQRSNHFARLRRLTAKVVQEAGRITYNVTALFQYVENSLNF
jgi:DNA primase catalytic subunit